MEEPVFSVQNQARAVEELVEEELHRSTLSEGLAGGSGEGIEISYALPRGRAGSGETEGLTGEATRCSGRRWAAEIRRVTWSAGDVASLRLPT